MTAVIKRHSGATRQAKVTEIGRLADGHGALAGSSFFAPGASPGCKARLQGLAEEDRHLVSTSQYI
jgi:hypothetical protein